MALPGLPVHQQGVARAALLLPQSPRPGIQPVPAPAQLRRALRPHARWNRLPSPVHSVRHHVNDLFMRLHPPRLLSTTSDLCAASAIRARALRAPRSVRQNSASAAALRTASVAGRRTRASPAAKSVGKSSTAAHTRVSKSATRVPVRAALLRCLCPPPALVLFFFF